MVGVEYDLWYFTYTPSLFVIRKQKRTSSTSVSLLSIYYIIEGTIYQAPNLQSVLSSRIQTSIYFCQKALEEAQQQVMFHPSLGYTWKKDAQYLEDLKRKSGK